MPSHKNNLLQYKRRTLISETIFGNCKLFRIKFNSNFMTSQPVKKTIVIHILPNISRSKSNQTMKFGQLIECNMKNIFLKNHTQNMVEKLVPDPFLKIRIEHNSGSIVYNFIQFAFFVWQVEGYRNISKLS